MTHSRRSFIRWVAAAVAAAAVNVDPTKPHIIACGISTTFDLTMVLILWGDDPL